MSVGSRARRARAGQLVSLMLVVAALVACAAFVPVATGTLQRALLFSRIDELGPLGRQVTVEANVSSIGRPEKVSFDELRRIIDPDVAAVTSDEVHRRRADVVAPGRAESALQVISSTGECEHLRFTAGRCPASTGDVAISQDQAAHGRLAVGSTVKVKGIPGVAALHVTGIYADPAADPFWTGYVLGPVRPVGGSAGFRQTWVGTDDLVARAGPALEVTRTLDPAKLTPQTLPAAIAGIERGATLVPTVKGNPNLRENIRYVDELVHADLDQIGVIVPLLVGQLILLVLVMAWLVTRAAVDLRRPELALARVRGLGRGGARRLVLGELWPAYAGGMVLGVAGAYGIDAIMRTAWLPGHLDAAWSWPSLVIAVAATAVALALLLVTTATTARTPLMTLLRTVPPRRAGALLGAGEIVLLVLALGGVAAVATGSLSGPFALATPFLAALAVGILASAALRPVASRLVDRSLRRGSVDGSLVLVQLARRPAAKQVLLALVVATTLVVFAFGAATAAAQHRERRAAIDVGTTSLLHVYSLYSAVGAKELVAAVDAVDPHHEHLTPVAVIKSPSEDGVTVLGVIPADLPRLSAMDKVPGLSVPWSSLHGLKTAIGQDWTSPRHGSFQAPVFQESDGYYDVAATAPMLPQSRPHLVAVDLAAAAPKADRQSMMDLQVWSDSTDPHAFDAVRKALGDQGFDIFSTTSTAERASQLAASAPAWGLEMARLVGAGAALVALLVLLAVLVSTAASRAADARALRRAGVPIGRLRRALFVEQLVLVGLGTLLGIGTGVLGSVLAYPLVPWFSTPPSYPMPPPGVPWSTLAVTIVVYAVVLVAAAALAGAWIARRSTREAR